MMFYQGCQSNPFLRLTLAPLIFPIKRYFFKSDSFENVLNERSDAPQDFRIKYWLQSVQRTKLQASKVEKVSKLPRFTVCILQHSGIHITQ